MADAPYIPFSQREGFVRVPEQLKLGEVSAEFRRLLEYYLLEEVTRFTRSAPMYTYLDSAWLPVYKDFEVRLQGSSIADFSNDPSTFKWSLRGWITEAPLPRLFDLIEFFYLHSCVSSKLRGELEQIFVETRSAYRMRDGLIIAIGTEQQGQAIIHAIDASSDFGLPAARQHLIAASHGLRSGDWAGSIRESINAVESAARNLVTDAQTLEPALRQLEKSGELHPALKQAFSKLYGFTSDQEGIRHAVVFQDATQVDEADALFMLGACASFVSFLLARKKAASD